MKLFFIRHGESVNNRDRIIHGWMGGELTEEGKEQAFEVGDVLRQMNPTIVFSSDLNRAAQTALEIKKSLPDTVELLLDWRLRERSFGEHEGKLIDDYDWADIISHLKDQSSYMGIETDTVVTTRLLSFIRDLHEFENNHAKVILVTHGGVIDCAKKFINQSLEFNYFKHTEILEIALEDFNNP